MPNTYRLVDGKVVVKDETKIIVNEVGNPLWQEYESWLLNGNTPMPATSEPLLEKFGTTSANIRNSVANEPQIITGRSPLIIDGLLAQGSFNRSSPTIWDGANSKIYPTNVGEDYLARVTIAVTTEAPAVITFDLDVNGLIIFKESFQPTAWDNDLNVKPIPFFSSANMVNFGATLNITSSVRAEIRNASIYIVRLPSA